MDTFKKSLTARKLITRFKCLRFLRTLLLVDIPANFLEVLRLKMNYTQSQVSKLETA